MTTAGMSTTADAVLRRYNEACDRRRAADAVAAEVLEQMSDWQTLRQTTERRRAQLRWVARVCEWYLLIGLVGLSAMLLTVDGPIGDVGAALVLSMFAAVVACLSAYGARGAAGDRLLEHELTVASAVERHGPDLVRELAAGIGPDASLADLREVLGHADELDGGSTAT